MSALLFPFLFQSVLRVFAISISCNGNLDEPAFGASRPFEAKMDLVTGFDDMNVEFERPGRFRLDVEVFDGFAADSAIKN